MAAPVSNAMLRERSGGTRLARREIVIDDGQLVPTTSCSASYENVARADAARGLSWTGSANDSTGGRPRRILADSEPIDAAVLLEIDPTCCNSAWRTQELSPLRACSTCDKPAGAGDRCTDGSARLFQRPDANEEPCAGV